VVILKRSDEDRRRIWSDSFKPGTRVGVRQTCPGWSHIATQRLSAFEQWIMAFDSRILSLR